MPGRDAADSFLPRPGPGASVAFMTTPGNESNTQNLTRAIRRETLTRAEHEVRVDMLRLALLLSLACVVAAADELCADNPEWPDCAKWAREGECENNKPFMHVRRRHRARHLRSRTACARSVSCMRG